MTASPRQSMFTDGQRLGFILEQVKGWSDYVRQPHPALDGSSLAADDAPFAVLPLSHLAWHGIVQAVDHLDMFMGALAAGKSHPLAPSTLARSGILGGAHALWLLEGANRAERQRRALRLAHEEFRRDREMLVDMDRISREEADTEPSGAQPLIDTRDEWIARAITTGATLGMRPGQVTARLIETAIIDDVAKRYAAATPDSNDLAKTYRLLWRIYSGTAHGLRWSSMHRTEIVPNEVGGGGNGLLTNDLSDLGMAASAVSLFTARAIDLYEIRRQPH